MKRIILAIIAIATAATLTGCVGSLGRSIYNAAATPDADICSKTLGLNVAEAEKSLNMGKADSVKKKISGDLVKVYSKGSLKAELVIAPDGKVLEATCEQIPSK